MSLNCSSDNLFFKCGIIKIHIDFNIVLERYVINGLFIDDIRWEYAVVYFLVFL